MNRRWLTYFYRFCLPGILLFFASGCRAPAAAPARPTDTGITPAAVQTIPPLNTDTPAATPTTPAGKVLLLAAAGSDPAKVASLQAVLAPLAQQSGLVFETSEALQTPDPSLRLVVAVPPDPGLLNLAAANPQVKFLAVGLPGIGAAPNISVAESGGERPDQQGFLAGYLSALVTPDWRAGVISVPGSAAGKAARNAFGNGLTFYCGLCRPAYPPFVQYPVYADLPDGFGDAELQAAVETMTANGVKTVYVAPGIDNPAFMEALAQAGFQIIGSGEPPASAAASWIATINSDESAAFQQIVQGLLNGEAAAGTSPSVALSNVNPSLLSAGRQRVLDVILQNLLSGYIDTGIDPQTGEPRS